MILTYADDKELAINSDTLINIDLSNKILSELHLDEQNVSGATFRNSDVHSSFFYRSDFSKVDFTHANLSDVNAGRGIFKKTNFSNVIMNNANLQFSDLKMANFQDAKLSNTDFSNAFLWGANFENANLTNANFENAIVAFCIFKGANLSNASFKNVKDLHSTQLTNATLENTNLTNVKYFKDIDFSKCKIYNPFFENCIQLNLLVLRCKDIEKSKEFYEKLKLVFIKEQHGKGVIHYSASIDDVVIELYPLNQDIVDNTRLGFSIYTKNIEKFLKNKKIEIDSKYIFRDVVTFVVKDPDNRKVELRATFAV